MGLRTTLAATIRAGSSALLRLQTHLESGHLDEELHRGLDGLSQRLQPHLEGCSSNFYVEIGANDGVGQSNTYFLERALGWRGLLVEPTIDNFLRLVANRAGDNHFFCAACVPDGFTDRFVPIVHARRMTTSLGLEADVDPESHIVAAGDRVLRDSDGRPVQFGAVAATLTSLLDRAGSPRTIGFFSLDVEGAELAVLRGVDHGRYRFERLLVEVRDLDRMRRYLEPLDYELRDRLSRHDYLFENTRQVPDGARAA